MTAAHPGRCHADAVSTLAAEVEAQPETVAAVLRDVAAQIPQARAAIRRHPPSLAVGVGDSLIVGRLAAALSKAAPVRPVGPDDIAACRIEHGQAAVCHSISGTTSFTLAAARWLTERGAQVIAITGDPNSPLAAVSAHSITLDIPRFPPDAKVPGTITSSAALLAHMLCLAGNDEPVEDLSCRYGGMLSTSLREAGAVLDSLGTDLVKATREAHIIGPSALAASSEYLQAKLAETVGWPAPVATFETWMHVSKHAVRPGTLVIQLGSLDAPEAAETVRREVELRGGRYLNSRAVPTNPDLTRLSITVKADVSPSLGDVLHEMAFAQLLALRLLRRHADWAPYQAHRLSAAQIRGLIPRHYEHASAGDGPVPGTGGVE